jgi:hypothetical protein
LAIAVWLRTAGLRRPDLVEPPVHLGVHPADEERRHRGDAYQVLVTGLLQAGEERIDDLAVPLQREDQRDVDADPLGQALGDRRDAPEVAGILM